MAIRKNSKNIIIRVKNSYHLTVGGKIEKIGERLNTEAKKGNLTLASNKKIISHGNK